MRGALALAVLLLSASAVVAQPSRRLSPVIEAAVAEAFAAMQVDGLEHAVCLDAEERITATVVGERTQIALACDPATTVTMIHTHPAGAAPSDTDISNFLSQDYPVLDRSVIIGVDGWITVLGGMNAGRPRSAQAADVIGSRFVLLTEMYRLASTHGPLTEVWPFARLCEDLGLDCLVGPSMDALAPPSVVPLASDDENAEPAFDDWMRQQVASWVTGQVESGMSWADLGDLAQSVAPSQRYRHAVYFNDNANLMNAQSALPSLVNLFRVVNGFGESFELLAGGVSPGQPDTCVRIGWGVNGDRAAALGDTAFIRLTAGDFDLICTSQDDVTMTVTLFQRIQDGRLLFYATAEDRDADRRLADVPADTGCGFDLERVERICDDAVAENFVLLGDQP